MTQTTPPEDFEILVAGGRTYTNLPQLTRQLDRLREMRPVTHIIHGAARGADSLAGTYAHNSSLPCTPYPPNRKLDGPGRDWKFRRNVRMLLTANPDLVIAFPGGPGTAHMVAKAKNLGYQVWDLRNGPDSAPLPELPLPAPAKLKD